MMFVATASRVSLLLVACVGASACSSDQPKRSDDAGAAAVAPIAPAVVDAGNDASVDAGNADVPVVETQVDAGHIGDPNAEPLAVDGPTINKDNKVDPIQVTIFNRLIVKPKAKGLTPQAVQELAEEATGKKVATVRRTAGTFFLIQFEPAKPARKLADQQKLMADLNKSGAFANIEGDQLMTIKH